MDKVTHFCSSRSKAHYLQKAFRGRWDISNSLQLCHFVEAQEICAPMKSDDSCLNRVDQERPTYAYSAEGASAEALKSDAEARASGDQWFFIFK